MRNYPTQELARELYDVRPITHRLGSDVHEVQTFEKVREIDTTSLKPNELQSTTGTLLSIPSHNLNPLTGVLLLCEACCVVVYTQSKYRPHGSATTENGSSSKTRWSLQLCSLLSLL